MTFLVMARPKREAYYTVSGSPPDIYLNITANCIDTAMYDEI